MRCKLAIALFLGCVTTMVPHMAHAQAALYLEPSTGVYPLGESFTVDVRIDTAGATIGTADAAIVYDPGDIEFVSVSDDGSVMSRILVDSGSASGRIDLSGFIERGAPAYNGTNGLLARLTFLPLRNVATQLRFAQGAATPPLLLNASVGDLANILGSLRSASYTFVPREVLPSALVAGASTDATGSFPITPLPVPDNEWFGTTSIRLSWTLPENIEEMRTFVTGTDEKEQEKVYQVPVSSIQLTDVLEGKNYFVIQFKSGGEWGEATRFPLNVDLTPPETIIIREIDRKEPTDKNAFVVEGTDDLSGVTRYEMSVDGGDTVPWDGQGTFTPEVPGPGEHTLTVTAYDRVGNRTSIDYLFLVRSLDAPVLTSVPERVLTGDTVIVRGMTYPNASVKAFVSFNEGEAEEKSVESDGAGAFEVKVTEGARAGTYTIWFQVSTSDGAMSPASIKRSLTVSQPYIMLWGGVAVTYLSVLVPLLALIILLGLVLWLGYTFLRGYRNKVRKETGEAYDVVHQEFALLRDDLRKQIGMLEKANQSRELTREEMKIFNDLSKRLDYIERHIEEEIGDISVHDTSTETTTVLPSRDTIQKQSGDATPAAAPAHTIRIERR